MSELLNNPFLEGSEKVSDEEAAIVLKALAEEAAAARSKAGDIKERAAKARVEKEAARKAELARIDAEIEAARAQVIETVARIPKASDKPTLRPAPPPTPETLVLSSGEAVTSGSGKFYSLDNNVSLPSLISDAVFAAIAVTFAFLIFLEM